MIHLFGSGCFGQNGSTLKMGISCARNEGTAGKSQNEEIAMAVAHLEICAFLFICVVGEIRNGSFAWANHNIIINNAPWHRTYMNRLSYVHPYTVPRYAPPPRPEDEIRPIRRQIPQSSCCPRPLRKSQSD